MGQRAEPMTDLIGRAVLLVGVADCAMRSVTSGESIASAVLGHGYWSQRCERRQRACGRESEADGPVRQAPTRPTGRRSRRRRTMTSLPSWTECGVGVRVERASRGAVTGGPVRRRRTNGNERRQTRSDPSVEHRPARQIIAPLQALSTFETHGTETTSTARAPHRARRTRALARPVRKVTARSVRRSGPTATAVRHSLHSA